MKKADRIYYGGDYNPDQWDDQTIDEAVSYTHLTLPTTPYV